MYARKRITKRVNRIRKENEIRREKGMLGKIKEGSKNQKKKRKEKYRKGE
jgi:hypothetical protein